MRKLRHGAVLASLVMVALLLATSLPVAGDSDDNHGNVVGFFRSLGQDLSEACERLIDEDVCRVVLRAAAVLLVGADGNAFDRVVTKDIGKALHLPRRATCGQCLNETKEFLDELASNQTINDVEQTLHAVCADEFHNATKVHQCQQFVDQVIPQTVQAIESRLTPQTVCEDLKFCKAP